MYTYISIFRIFLWSPVLYSPRDSIPSCMLSFLKLSVALYLCMADRCHRFGATQITLALAGSNTLSHASKVMLQISKPSLAHEP